MVQRRKARDSECLSGLHPTLLEWETCRRRAAVSGCYPSADPSRKLLLGTVRFSRIDSD